MTLVGLMVLVTRQDDSDLSDGSGSRLDDSGWSDGWMTLVGLMVG